MESTKLKNAVIFILLVVNIFFLTLFLLGRAETGKLDRQARGELTELLESNGISCDEKLLAASLPAAVSGARDSDFEKSFAESLLGVCESSDLGGGISRYDSALGYATFRRSGNFLVSFTDGLPFSSPSLSSLSSWLKKSGLTLQSVSEDSGVFTFLCLFEGAPVLNCSVAVRTDGESVVSVSGRLAALSSLSASGSETSNVYTAVVRFLSYLRSSGRLCSEIRSVSHGFAFSSSGSGGGELEPLWCVSTDAGMYYVNSITSAVSVGFD